MDGYWFEISHDGYYAVEIMDAVENEILVDVTASEAINQGLGAVNRLRVVCDGSEFSFYVNGTLLTELSDTSFSSGSIGLAVGVYDESGMAFHFDNLRLRALSQP